MTSKCEACRADAPVLENKEIQELLSQIPSWRVFEEDDTKKIICSFIFLNYDDSRNFLNKVADLAEEEDHHPEITLGYNSVCVKYFTYAIDGLSENDFICAAKVDKIILI